MNVKVKDDENDSHALDIFPVKLFCTEHLKSHLDYCIFYSSMNCNKSGKVTWPTILVTEVGENHGRCHQKSQTEISVATKREPMPPPPQTFIFKWVFCWKKVNFTLTLLFKARSIITSLLIHLRKGAWLSVCVGGGNVKIYNFTHKRPSDVFSSVLTSTILPHVMLWKITQCVPLMRGAL